MRFPPSERSRYLWIATSILLAFPVFQALRELLTVAWLLRDPLLYVADSTIYWGLGRSILNGLTLYKDIFDNKPLGMPLLSAASVLLFGNGALGSLLGALIVIFLPLLITLFVWRLWRKEKSDIEITVMVLFAFFFSSLLTLYHVERSGPWQSELFGGLFAVLYVFCIYGSPRALPWWKILLAGLALLGAAGTKEPFFISCLASALLIDHHPRALLKSFVLPAGIALAIGIIVLLLLGSLGAYLSIYLPGIVGFRVSSFGSPWMRGVFIHRVIQNLGSFSLPLLILLAALITKHLASLFFERSHPMKDTIIRPIAFFAALYLVTFSVGVGGDYQAHHFSFALPFYVTIFLLGMQGMMQWSHYHRLRYGPLVLLFLSSISFVWVPPVRGGLESLRMRNGEAEQQLRPAASALDAIMDACALDRYLYVEKTHQLMLYGYTKHSPENYLLFWEIDNAIQYGHAVANTSFDHISRGKILIVPKEGGFVPVHDMGNVIAQYFNDTFTAEVPPCAQHLPAVPGYFVYFRTVEKKLPLRAEQEEDGGLVVRKIEK